MLLQDDIDPSLNNEVGQRIRALRKARGWTYDEMVRRTGLSRGTLYDAETKKDRRPWYTSLKAIADAFGVTVEYLSEGKLLASEKALSDFTPPMYAMAQGLRNPEYVRQWGEHLAALKCAEMAAEKVGAEERTLDSYSVEEFARAKGLKDKDHVAKWQKYLEKLLGLEQEFEVE